MSVFCAIGQGVQAAVTTTCLTFAPQRPTLCATLGVASHAITDATGTYLLKKGYDVLISDTALSWYTQANSEDKHGLASDPHHSDHHHEHTHEHHHDHGHDEHFFTYSRIATMTSGVAGATLGSWMADKALANQHAHHHQGQCQHNHGGAGTIVKIGAALLGSYAAESLASYLLTAPKAEKAQAED